MEKSQIGQNKNKEYKKDVIVATISLLALILLLLSTIMFPFASMNLGKYLNPMYDLGPGGGYEILSAIVIGFVISGVIGVIILIIMLVLRKKKNIQEFLLKIYFGGTFLIQIYLVQASYFGLVREQFNLVKTINSIIFLFISIWYIYFPVIIMFLAYLIIKSINKIRKMEVE